jgi:hypothetical protein
MSALQDLPKFDKVKLYNAMLSVKGYYEKGHVFFNDEPQISGRTEVIITFLSDEKNERKAARVPGGLAGKVGIPDDFNDPIEDLKDYM